MTTDHLDEGTLAGLTPVQRLENLADELRGLDARTTLRDDSDVTGPGRAVAVLIELISDMLGDDELAARRVLRLDPDFEGAVRHAHAIGDYRTVVMRLAKLIEQAKGDAPDAAEQIALLQGTGESNELEDDADLQAHIDSLRAERGDEDPEPTGPRAVD